MKKILVASTILCSLVMAGSAFAEGKGPDYQYGTLKAMTKDGTLTFEDGMSFNHASAWEMKHIKVGQKVAILYDTDDNQVLWVRGE